MEDTMISLGPEIEENSPFYSTSGTNTTRSLGKTRRLKIIRNKDKNAPPAKATRHMYVTRKPKDDEIITIASPTLDTLSYDSDSPREVYARGSNGEVLKHSILGSVEDLQKMEKLMDSQSDGDGLGGCATTGSPVTDNRSPAKRSPLSKTARTTSFRSPLTNRSGKSTTGGNRSAAPLPRDTIPDPTKDREGYMDMLEERHRRAQHVREQEMAAEKELMELLPMEEKVMLKREGMVLERWQKHLDEWDKVKKKLGTKIGRNKGKMVMDAGEEFRERTEEFDVLQMAIPPIDKQAQSFWMMNLRDNNEKSERVGNVMTGLYCPVRERQHPPAIIRKPIFNTTGHTSHHQGDNGTATAAHLPKWKSSEYYTAMKKRLKKRLPNVRPHDVTEEELGGLNIDMPDLFEWAIKSSSAYFYNMDEMDREQQQQYQLEYSTTITDGSYKLNSPSNTFAGTEFDIMSHQAETVAGTMTLAGSKRRGPCLEVGPNTHLLFESKLNSLVQGTLVLRNTGSTAIFYNVVKKARPTPLTATYHAHEREKVVPEMHPFFACHDTHGMILPNAQHTIIFTFKADHTGLFSEDWLLRLTPKVHVSYKAEESHLDEEDTYATPTQRRTTTGSVPLFLQGSCCLEDNNEHKRLALRQAIEQGTWVLKVRELVTDMIRGVHTPRREEVILQKERSAFESINFWQGLYYDKERYAAFHDLHDRVRAYLVDIKRTAMEANGSSSNGDDEEDDEEWLPSKWDSSVTSIRQGIEKILSASNKQSSVSIEAMAIRALPPPPSAPLTAEEKKAQRRRRCTQGDNSANMEQLIEIDSILQDVVGFSDELRVLQFQSAMRPAPRPETAAREALSGLADAIEHAAIQARESNGMTLEEKFQSIPSTAWEAIMASAASAEAAVIAESQVDAKAKSPTKKDAVAAKGKRSSAADPPAGSTPAQIDKYRYDFYKNLYPEISGITENFTAAALEEDATYAQDYRQRTSLTVTGKGVVRPDDVEGRCVVLYVDLDVSEQMVFVENQDAWILPEKARRAAHGPFASAVTSIRAILACAPASLIIISRLTQPTNFTKDAPPMSFSSLAGDLAEAIDAPITFLSCLSSNASFKHGLSEEGIYFVEHIESDTLCTPLSPQPSVQSDDEDERLPTFEDEVTKRRRIKREQKEKKEAMKLDIGKVLSGVADLVIVDDPRGCLDEKSPLFNLKTQSNWILAGPVLHHDLNAASYYIENSVRPRLAIVGGMQLSDRITLIDVLIDTVDTLFLGGAVAVNFLHASGMHVGAAERLVDKGLVPIVKELLNKAQRSPVKLILPIDAVMGDAGVTKTTVEEPKSEEDEDEDEDESESNEVEGENIDENGNDKDGGEVAEASQGVISSQEDEDPAGGFDYDYQTTIASFDQEFPLKHFILDLGPQTINLLQESIQESSTILWDGVLGAVECSAFQAGTRAIVSSLIQAHDEAGKVVLVNGGTTAKWARLFGDVGNDEEEEAHNKDARDEEGEEEEITLEKIKGFSHVFHECTLVRRVLATIPVPMVESLVDRAPDEEELLLYEELRVREIERLALEKEERQQQALEEEKEEEDEEQDDDAEEQEED